MEEFSTSSPRVPRGLDAKRRSCAADFGKEKCVHQLIAEQAKRRPDALAVADQHKELTYRELDERSEELARQLQELGVSVETIVGVCLERSVDLVIALLAILKAGGAYLPLDPEQPQERLQFMLRDAGAQVLLVSETARPFWLSRMGYCPVVAVDGPSTGVNGCLRESQSARGSRVQPNNLAYVIYTSGTTGRPKGVAIEHASLSNLVKWHQDTYHVTPADRATLVASPAFDASTWEIWPYLSTGASLHIPDNDIRRSPSQLVAWLLANRITLTFVPTPLAEAMLEESWPKQCALRAVLTGGDTLRRGTPENFPCALVNHYGPTETTVVATAGEVPKGGAGFTPSIGRPIHNAEIYILTPDRLPVPPGESGELYIGGTGVARGYLNRPELTAERFLPSPFNSLPGARLYRTGDLVRLNSDGNLDFLGRTDDQVKIRGNRVDPGEVETVLRAHPAVRKVAVSACTREPGQTVLAAYLTTQGPSRPTVQELREFSSRLLPDYMVPAAFVFLDELPLNANGKLARGALPPVTWEAEADFFPPRTPTEVTVAGIWCELLHRERVGIHDNFFHLGGHSLLAARVLARIQRKLKLPLQVAHFFNAPTLAGLSEVIDAVAATQPAAGRNITEAVAPGLPGRNGNGTARSSEHETCAHSTRVEEKFPTGIRRDEERQLSFAQERLWFLEQLEPGVPFNNVPIGLRAKGTVDIRAMEGAIAEVIQRHETLRCEFRERKGRPVAFPRLTQPFALEVIDLSHLPESQREEDARRIMEAEARQPFDLTEGLMLRAKLLRLNPVEHLLVLVTHHIACDGWSMAILFRELSVVYNAIVEDGPWSLPEPAIEYSDFASWQRSQSEEHGLANQLAYWKEQLAAAPTTLALPTDRPRPPVQTYRGAIHAFRLAGSLQDRLSAMSQQENVTMFMLLLSAWQTLLHRYSGQEQILVGSPVAGRKQLETEGLIGIFLNMLVLRGNLSGDPSFRMLLQRVRQMALAAYAHQDLPFEKLVEALQPDRDLSRSPLFQVMFVWHNEPTSTLELHGLQLQSVPLHNGTAKFDLTVSLEPAGHGLNGFVEYNTDLYDEATIIRMIGHLQTLLEGIVANPDERLSRLPLLTEAERRQLLVDWNGNRVEFPEQCVHQCFEEQVERTPNAGAVVFDNEELTYRELDRQANALAHKLHELGVGPDSRVGLCMERSLELMVSMLGILKAGGAYVPLDPTYPKERLAFMVQDAGIQALLTQEKFQLPSEITSALGTATSLSILELRRTQDPTGSSALKLISLPGGSRGSRNAPQRSAPRSGVTPDHLAYMIYTSGSTGQPKGVMVTHRNVLNFFAGMDQLLGREAGIWLAVTSISFDISVLELFWTLARGYKVILHHDFSAERTDTGNSSGEAPRRVSSALASRPAGDNGLTISRNSANSRHYSQDAPRRSSSPSTLPLLEPASSGSRTESRGMDFSLFYFASEASEEGTNKYRLLLEGAKFADNHGFHAIWTPERHFHAFGGLYPNPSVTAAALAMVTQRIRIRAGSVVLPLHDVIRVAEEWALVDNLSRGRVDMSFASGWHANDFVLRPDNYPDRHAALFRDIDVLRRLWRGESVQRRNGTGQDVSVRVLPRPVQPELPLWVTAAGSVETFRKAGEIGANLLTHLLGQSIEELSAKIAVYRAAWSQAGHSPNPGKVSLMLHTFVGEDADEVREIVRRPFSEYLKTSLDLIAKNASLGFDPKKLTPDDVETLIARVFDRYFETSGLFGTPSDCLKRVGQLKAIGVDEIACLIDFGVESETVLASLTHLNELREGSNVPDDFCPFSDATRRTPNGSTGPAISSPEGEPPHPLLSIPEQIVRHGVTHLQCTPSLAAMLLQDSEAPAALGRLQKLLLGGEALPSNLAAQLQQVFHGQMLNLYGPTETTIWSTAHVVEDPTHGIPIGRPLANTEVYVVDRNEQLLPVGIPGELLIGGAGVARGYHQRLELTGQKFIRHPFRTDPRLKLYRTGDLARYTANGRLEFLGRIDQQVKVRGHRIELGEVETVLGQHPQVSEAVVITWGDSPVNTQLTAYVVPKRTDSATVPGQTFGLDAYDAGALREFVKQRLPDYMVPSIVTFVETLPLTANGKVDRRSLPAPDASFAAVPSTFVAPSNQTEEVLARIWGDVLGRKQIGVHDNFFDLGGHSLLIMQVLARIREAFQIDLRMRCLFDWPTIAGLARAVEGVLVAEINGLPENEANRLAGAQSTVRF
jgi:natural product biosynthesis luciferase-like monooxygenase protein/amino acid adenylation domain-containing protein